MPEPRCLVLSDGPVPTPEHDKVEGGGLRCWGLAKGLAGNGVDVTVAYNDFHRKDGVEAAPYEGVDVRTWTDAGLEELVAGYDSVVVSYCMGSLSIRVSELVRPDQQLILDCYVPIYVEHSARGSKDVEAEYNSFHFEIGGWSQVLRRGDRFLCASLQQKEYYLGVLSALGRVNPATYGEELILVVPYGIYEEAPAVSSTPIEALVGTGVKKILWFGGIYPWFDIRDLLQAVRAVREAGMECALVIVGAKNPFNKNPDFLTAYEELVAYAGKPEFSGTVYFQDWVGFDARGNWYMDADLVVTINRIGPENKLAWRTRMIDYLWADLPMLTNGGDPFSEILFEADAAIRMPGLDAGSIAAVLTSLLTDPAELKKVRKNLAAVRPRFYWKSVTRPLAAAVTARDRASDMTRFGAFDVGSGGVNPPSRAKKIAAKLRRLPEYRRRYGTVATAQLARAMVGRKLRKLRPARRSARLVVISHQLDQTGGPYALMNIMAKLRAEEPLRKIEFHTFHPIFRGNISILNAIGIKPILHIQQGVIFDFHPDDVLLLNTVAHAPETKYAVYSALKAGRLRKCVWYIHEDEPELQFGPEEAEVIRQLLRSGKMVLHLVSLRVQAEYRKFFGEEEGVKLSYYPLRLPASLAAVRTERDFEQLDFILPGTVSDGRKGQLPILYAFAQVAEQYVAADPGAYRPFTLTFVGLEHDFLSRQVRRHAEALGGRLRLTGKLAHGEALERIKAANVTICYSLREALPMFVFEGMTAGHVLLRNDCAGQEEQLAEGGNGYLLPSGDYQEVVRIIERMLNRKSTSGTRLSEMSAVSRKIVAKFAEDAPIPLIGDLL